MDWKTAAEEAYKNGREAGFCEGLEAAGISPIQWRSTEIASLPKSGDILVVTCDGDYHSGQVSHSKRPEFIQLIVNRTGGSVWLPIRSIKFWCPINIPK